MGFEKYFKGLKRHYYVAIIAGILAIVYLLNTIIYFPAFIWAYLLILFVMAAITYTALRKTRKYMAAFDKNMLPERETLERYFDRYGRRLLNWIMIGFWEVFSFFSF